MKKNPQLIVALDVDDFKKGKYFVDKLSGQVDIFKVGSQLFCSCGPKIIEHIHKKNREVFLDLKFFDIPNTVANAARQAVRLGVKMFTLHISGGKVMLEYAVKAVYQESKAKRARRPLLVGVTVLTSQEATFKEVAGLAKLGLGCGLDGLVASVNETALLKKTFKNKKFFIVTPGIRPDSTDKNDQKRVATASEAIKAGSDFLVVGRPILEAKNPQKIIKELI